MIASTFARQPRRRQQGVALIMALVFLMILTIIGVTALSTTSLQEKMAGNVQDKHTAFQAAESALREAEGIVLGWTAGTTPAFTGSGYYQPKLATDPYPWWGIDTTWTDSTAHIAAAAVAEAALPPSYIIEELGSVGGSSAGTGSLVAGFAPPAAVAGGSTMYRITARAVGRTQSAVAMVQSVFRK
jgi:type IV pilus assembly protein PilX